MSRAYHYPTQAALRTQEKEAAIELGLRSTAAAQSALFELKDGVMKRSFAFYNLAEAADALRRATVRLRKLSK